MKKSQSEENQIYQEKCDIEHFKLIVGHFNQDLKEFWTRANFYLLVNSGLISAFFIVYPTLIDQHLLIVSIIPILGIAIAVVWFFVLRGSLFWISKWRKEAIRLSIELDRFQCFASVENLYLKNKSKSPSYLTQFIPIIFLITWISIFLFLIQKNMYIFP